MNEQQALQRRLQQLYRDVVATTPLSDTFDTGRMKDAYVHGVHMVEAHTGDLMVQRVMEVIQERQREFAQQILALIEAVPLGTLDTLEAIETLCKEHLQKEG